MSDDVDRQDLAEIVRDVTAYARYAREIGDAYLDAGPSRLDEQKPEVEGGVSAETVRANERESMAQPMITEVARESGSPRESLEAIRAELGDCTRCKLHTGRTNIVYGEGNPNASLMFAGEGPGADEDASGRPFVGAAGQLLDRIIESIGFRREDVYIANVVKCRPPGNRAPERDESSTCEPFLHRQILAVAPKIIVALGNTPVQSLLGFKGGITKLRGQFFEFRGIPVMPTFHPAYLLRDPSKKREVWEDVKLVKARLDR
jgi:uracil-DNA glycosylase family 4